MRYEVDICPQKLDEKFTKYTCSVINYEKLLLSDYCKVAPWKQLASQSGSIMQNGAADIFDDIIPALQSLNYIRILKQEADLFGSALNAAESDFELNPFSKPDKNQVNYLYEKIFKVDFMQADNLFLMQPKNYETTTVLN